MEKKTRRIALLFALALAIAAALAGCSKDAGPTEADIVKAVIQHAIAENCGVLTPTIRIVEKGKRREDGTVPYRVRYACRSAAKAGAVQQNDEREVMLHMHQSTDGTGKPGWFAK